MNDNQPKSRWTKERSYESSNVASGRYDSSRQRLEVTFNNGSTYHYKDVPASVWRGLNRVKSKGKFVHRRLKKPGFEYEKVAERAQLVKLAELNPEIELFPTQERARRRFLDRGQILLAHGTGTGKTIASIAAVESGRDAGKVSRTLVVAPTSLRQNYVDTVKNVTQNRTVTTLGSKQEASKGEAEPVWTRNAGDYNVVGIEMFRKDPEGIVDRLGIDTVVFDEAHKGNNPQTSTHKALMRVRPRLKNVVAMTGSEVTNNPADIIPLLDFVTNKKHDLPGQSTFKKDYIRKLPDRSKGFLWWKKKIRGEHVLRPERIRELREALAPHVDYATLDDLRGDDVPKKEISTVPVEMSKHQRKLYDYAMRQAGSVASHMVKKNVPPNAQDVSSFFKSLMLARKASNSIHTLDTGVSPEISAFQTPKTRKLLTDLKEHLDTTPDGQVMVYSNFINGGADVVTAGLKQMGIPYGVFLGKQNEGSSETERQQAVDDYKKGKKRVLVVSSAGTEGINLPDTTMIQMLDGHYNPAKIQQAEARGIRAGGQAHRKPEDRKVDIRRYVSKTPRGTSVDEWVYNIAERKDGLVGQFREVLKTMPSNLQFMDKQSSALRRRIKTAAEERGPSSLVQDFAAGIDPLGVWTNDYGARAEEAGLSTGEHALKNVTGITGGLVGGGLVIPGVTLGVISSMKGLKNPGKRLKSFLAGWKDAASLPQMLVHGNRARKALARKAQDAAAKFSDKEAKSINYLLGKQTPAFLGSAPSIKSVDNLINNIPAQTDRLVTQPLNRARQRLQKITPTDIQNSRQYALNTADDLDLVSGTGTLPPSVQPYVDKASVYLRRAAGSDIDVDDVREADKLIGQAVQGVNETSSMAPKLLWGQLADRANDSYKKALTGLGIGAGVGGLGAGLQYNLGRSSERRTQERLREAKTASTKDQMNPNLPNPQLTMAEYQRRSMGGDDSYSKAIPTTIGGTSGTMTGRVIGDALQSKFKRKGLGKAIGIGATLAGSVGGGAVGHYVGKHLNKESQAKVADNPSFKESLPTAVGGAVGWYGGQELGTGLARKLKLKGAGGHALAMGGILSGLIGGSALGHAISTHDPSPPREEYPVVKRAAVKIPNRKLENRYSFQGLPVSIETAKGSKRSGTDSDGHEWSVKMNCDYGYIRGTEGGDGEHLDVFIGPHDSATHAYVVRQIHPKSGKFDEDKVLLGFKSKEAAWKAYKGNYDRLDHVQGIREIPLDAFKAMLKVHRGNRLSVDDRYLEKMSWAASWLRDRASSEKVAGRAGSVQRLLSAARKIAAMNLPKPPKPKLPKMTGLKTKTSGPPKMSTAPGSINLPGEKGKMHKAKVPKMSV